MWWSVAASSSSVVVLCVCVCVCVCVPVLVASTVHTYGMDASTIPYHTIPYHTIPYHTIPAAHGHWCAFTDLYHTIPYHTPLYQGNLLATVLFQRTPFTEGCAGAISLAPWPSIARSQLKKMYHVSVDLFGTGQVSVTDIYHTIPWVCYRRRNQWLRLALALFCLPLIWLARVVYLLVGVAEGWGGRRGYAYPCVVLGHAMLRYSVGVGLGVWYGMVW